MKINIITKSIKPSTYFKHIYLSRELKKFGIDVNILTDRYRIGQHKDFINQYKNDNIYENYINEVKNLSIECYEHLPAYIFKKVQTNFFKKISSYEDDYFLIGMELPPNLLMNEFSSVLKDSKKIIFYKTRLCNDIFRNGKEALCAWLPSEVYISKGSLGLFLSRVKKYPIDFVKPLEICDIDNNLIDIDVQKKHIIEKYRIDENKPTIFFNMSNSRDTFKNDDKIGNTDVCIFRRLLTDKILSSKFNILISPSPYYYWQSKEQENPDNKIIEHIDYSCIMRSGLVSIIIGGISTCISESLMYKIPVLNISPNFIAGVESQEHLDRHFGKSNVLVSDRFEGYQADVDDNWIEKINMLINNKEKFDYEKKKKIWFSNNLLGNQIIQTFIKKKSFGKIYNDSSNETNTQSVQS